MPSACSRRALGENTPGGLDGSSACASQPVSSWASIDRQVRDNGPEISAVARENGGSTVTRWGT